MRTSPPDSPVSAARMPALPAGSTPQVGEFQAQYTRPVQLEEDRRPAAPESAPPAAAETEPPRRVLHCDMDCFYAAVHMRDDPSLRGRPVVIGGRPEERGVVAAASYEVRRYGVHSAMPSSRARRLCPDAVFLPPDFRRYQRESEKIFAIYRDFTPLVQAVSIDEAYLDVSRHLGEAGSATALAREIRRRVKEERGLTVSVGVGPNKLIAKIASDFQKPDGLTVVRPEKVQAFLDPLAVRRLHGVGPATEKALGELGVQTVADLRVLDVDDLVARFGKHGRILHEFAHGIDDRPVETHTERKSLGTENTYTVDLRRIEEMEAEIERMSREVADGLFRRGLAACTVTLKVRYADFTTLTRSRTFSLPVHDAGTIAGCARDLLRKTEAVARPVRLLGVTASTLVQSRLVQLPLFP
jgi:DNA polymerase-4